MTKRARIVAVTALAALSLAFVSVFDPSPRYVWNLSPSAPTGLYRATPGDPEIGDYVLIAPDQRLAGLIAERRYFAPQTPLLKRVAAVSGEEICRRETTIFINANPVAIAQRHDSAGRTMPVWSGCFQLAEDAVFLLNAHPHSLDGRYFGATRRADIITVVKGVWTRREPP